MSQSNGLEPVSLSELARRYEANELAGAELVFFLGAMELARSDVLGKINSTSKPEKIEPVGKLLTPEEAAEIARWEPRYLLRKTRKMSFRQGTKRKPRFEERGLRDWLRGSR